MFGLARSIRIKPFSMLDRKIEQIEIEIMRQNAAVCALNAGGHVSTDATWQLTKMVIERNAMVKTSERLAIASQPLRKLSRVSVPLLLSRRKIGSFFGWSFRVMPRVGRER